MTDEEVVRALLVLARKLGVENRLVVAIQHGIGDRETAATEEQALCLAVDKRLGRLRLLCSFGAGHEGACSWERATVGMSACGAQEWGTNGHRMSCILRTGHEGAHGGVDADGKSMVTWPCPCHPDCTGHVVTPAAQKAIGDVDWSAVRLTSDSPELRCGARSASENPVMAGQVCELLRGHEGPHEATVNGQRWVFSASDPSTSRT